MSHRPISPPPITAWDPRALPPYLSNGVLGLRLAWPGVGGGTTIVNGFAGLDPTDGVEGFARAPFALASDIELEGVRASVDRARCRLVEQRLDFATGELHTTWTFRVDDVTATVEVLSYAARSLPAIAVQEIAVSTDRAAALGLSAGIDRSDVPGRPDEVQQPPRGGPIEGVDGRLLWHSHGDIDRLGIAYATELSGAADAERTVSPRDQRGHVSTTYHLRTRAGRRVHLRQLTAMVPQMSHHQPEMQAGRIAALGVERGWAALRAENREIWREQWRVGIEVDTDDARWQAITDASVYYLLSSVHASSLASCSLFGLAFWPDYHYYHGHVMWDIETFTVPPLTLLAPTAARAMLDYRRRTLGAAMRGAALAGRRGALYPWESCPLHGEEVTPGARPGLQDHVSLDVALAFERYVHATGDLDEARALAWPVMRAVADYAASRIEWTRRGAEWRGTLGPREHYQPIDNNAFVNASAVRTLDAAIELAGRLGIAPPAEWEPIARALRMPVHTRRGMLLNHDRARLSEPKGATPEGAAALFPAGYRTTARIESATYRYAVEQQAPTFLGTPMLSPLLPVFAARAGDRAASRDLLERGYGAFIDPPWSEPDEFPVDASDKPRAAPMFAHIGGYLSGLLFGYPGVRMHAGDPSSWPERPVVLPEGWRSIQAPELWIRRTRGSLTAVQGTPRAEISIADPVGHRPRR
jgi:trehalose/maltose hydrolase-like predicted phosphorylase